MQQPMDVSHLEQNQPVDRGSHLMLFCALLMVKKGLTVEQCFKMTPLSAAARDLAKELGMAATVGRPITGRMS